MIWTLRALWGMARPLIMLSVILVFIAGTLIAYALGFPLNTQALIWGLGALLLVVTSIHYVNEYADYKTDALTTPTPYSGGSGVLPGGTVPRDLALKAGWIALLAGLLAALAGIMLGTLNWPSLVVLVIGAVGGWMYSLPPLALAWNGWGEVDNAVLGGIVLPLYGYTVQTGMIDWQVIAGCVPFAMLTFINLLCTTWADRDADAQVGKRTLATRLSIVALRRLYLTAAASSFGLLLIFSERVLPAAVVSSSFLALPVTIWGFWRYTRLHSPHPTVFAMVTMLLAQMAAWFRIGFY